MIAYRACACRNAGAGSFKSQFKKADKSGALYALILGEDELQGQTIAIKPLRTDEPQQTVAWDALSETLQVFFNQDSSLTN